VLREVFFLEDNVWWNPSGQCLGANIVFDYLSTISNWMTYTTLICYGKDPD